MCEVASDQAAGHPNIRRSLEVASVSSKSLLHLITELLTFSKNQVGRVAETMVEEEFEIFQLKTQMKAIFGKMAADKAIALKVKFQPVKLKEMVFLGDGNRISQVLINLISNSLKFTPRQGCVQVQIKLLHEFNPNDPWGDVIHETRLLHKVQTVLPSADMAEESVDYTVLPEALNNLVEPDRTYLVSFRVSDNGPGIPLHLQNRVFEPFVQADISLSKAHEGVGLGLSICRQIAKMLDGTISLTSVEGEGATFTMLVPLKFVKYQGVEYGRNNRPRFSTSRNIEPPCFPATMVRPLLPRDQPVTAGEATSNIKQKPRILVAEDNATNRTVIVQMLKIQKVNGKHSAAN